MLELRCDSRMHALIDSEGNLEVKCRDRFCGAGPGAVVLHKFDVKTGRMIKTVYYRDPTRRKE